MAVDRRWSKNREAHRTLHSGSRGLDVAQLQHALNHRAEARSEFGYKPVTPDGDFGPRTRELWIAMAGAIGLRHRRCTPGEQVLMRSPWLRDASMKVAERHWTHDARAALARRKARGGHGDGAHALQFMLNRAGWVESPAGSNDSAFLRHWRDELHMPWMRGQPWCGFAILAAYHYATDRELPQGVVYTPNIVQWAREGRFFRAVPAGSARPGDLVVFNFPGGHPVADHVGLARGPARGGRIPTCDGNTSFDNAGSQSNGGAIALKDRSLGFVAVVARPR